MENYSSTDVKKRERYTGNECWTKMDVHHIKIEQNWEKKAEVSQNQKEKSEEQARKFVDLREKINQLRKTDVKNTRKRRRRAKRRLRVAATPVMVQSSLSSSSHSPNVTSEVSPQIVIHFHGLVRFD